MEVILMRGISGSGKSTKVREIVDREISVDVVSADDYWIRPDGLYDFNFRNIGLAHKWCQEQYIKSLDNDWCSADIVIVDNTNTTMREMQFYIDAAVERGIPYKFVEPDTAWKFNVAECTKRNTHGVPEATIQKMLDRWEKV